MKEIWKDIKGYEGLYQISNLGRAKSLERIVHGNYKSGKRFEQRWQSVMLVLSSEARGYLKFTVSKNSIRRTLQLHREMAIAFLPNPENKPEVDHINGDKSDNRLENLRWATKSENQVNTPKNKTNTTGFKNIMFQKRKQRYHVDFLFNGNRVQGSFSIKRLQNEGKCALEEAKKFAAQIRKELHGDFARD